MGTYQNNLLFSFDWNKVFPAAPPVAVSVTRKMRRKGVLLISLKMRNHFFVRQLSNLYHFNFLSKNARAIYTIFILHSLSIAYATNIVSND